MMPNETEAKTDVIIIGAGPAGIAAALWCSDMGVDSVVLERAENAGGQLLSIHNRISNYPGLKSRNGRELFESFLDSLGDSGSEIVAGADITNIDCDRKTVEVTGIGRFSGKAVIIATGVSRRKLDADGEDRFKGRGILESGVRDRNLAAGKRVLIVGGGDAAVENAILLAEFAERVWVVHRGNALSARPDFVDKAISHGKIEFKMGTTLRSFGGSQNLESVTVQQGENGADEVLAIDLALIRIGVEPNTAAFAGQVLLDPEGYVKVNSIAETSTACVFAVGDVANPVSPTISTAVGTAATAVKAIFALIKNRT